MQYSYSADSMSNRATQSKWLRRRFLVILGGLLLGGVAAAVTYFLFPGAIATLAALLGLTGPLAFIVPLVAVGLIAGLYGMGLAAFIEEKYVDATRGANHPFMLKVVIISWAIAGAALGAFIVASTPAAFTLLPVAGLAGVILHCVMASLVTLLLTAAIGYFFYDISVMKGSRKYYANQSVIGVPSLNATLEDQNVKPVAAKSFLTTLFWSLMPCCGGRHEKIAAIPGEHEFDCWFDDFGAVIERKLGFIDKSLFIKEVF